MVISPPFNNLHLLFPNKIFIFLFQTFIFDYSFHHPLLCFSRKFRPRKSDPNLPPSPLVDLVFSRNFENVSIFILKLQWVDIQTESWVGLSLWCGISFGDCLDRRKPRKEIPWMWKIFLEKEMQLLPLV